MTLVRTDRPGRTPPRSTRRPRPPVTTTPSTSARSESRLVTLARSSRSRFSALCEWAPFILLLGTKVLIRAGVHAYRALLDEGETDWKVIVVDVNDPLASKLNDIEDVERHLPGLVRATNEWFRIYKIPDGKPENNFAFSGEAKNKKYAIEIIHECHEAWRKLISGESPAKTKDYELSM